MKYKIIAWLLAYPVVMFAQKNVSHQQTYWIRYQNQLVFSNRLMWSNEIDNRRFFKPGMQNQLIIHTRVNYLLKNFEPAVGCSFSWQYAQEPEVGYDVVVPEIRPFQEVTYHTPLSKKIKFNNRLRMDDRFLRNHTNTELTEGYTFILRFRLRSQVAYTLKENCILRFGDELFINDRGNTFDQNRVFLYVEFILSRKYAIEAGYLHIYQQRANNKGFFARDIARLTFAHKIFLKRTEDTKH